MFNNFKAYEFQSRSPNILDFWSTITRGYDVENCTPFEKYQSYTNHQCQKSKINLGI
jgi:hypothetical protein